jgi:SAM-dependent methyltransferase
MLSTTARTYRRDRSYLFHPCHCGGEEFRRSRLLTFSTCEVVRCIQCGQRRTYPEPGRGDVLSIYKVGAAAEKYDPATANDPEHMRMWAQFSKQMLDELEPFAPQRGRLLDVGCNFGELLVPARERGWQAEGLEITPSNVARLRSLGFMVYDRPIEGASEIEDDRFDAVVSNNVLEHVVRPEKFLAGIARVLKPGGMLYLGLPIFWGPIPVILKREKWYSLLPEEHVWQYSQSDVLGLVKRAGFRVLWHRRGCSGFWGTLSARPKDVARWLVYKSIKWLGLGDFIALVARNEK